MKLNEMNDGCPKFGPLEFLFDGPTVRNNFVCIYRSSVLFSYITLWTTFSRPGLTLHMGQKNNNNDNLI